MSRTVNSDEAFELLIADCLRKEAFPAEIHVLGQATGWAKRIHVMAENRGWKFDFTITRMTER